MACAQACAVLRGFPWLPALAAVIQPELAVSPVPPFPLGSSIP